MTQPYVPEEWNPQPHQCENLKPCGSKTTDYVCVCVCIYIYIYIYWYLLLGSSVLVKIPDTLCKNLYAVL